MTESTSSYASMDFGGLIAVLIIFFLGLLAFGAFKGFRRGLVRQSIRTGTIVLTVIICFIIIAGFVGTVDDTFVGNTLGGVLEEFGAGDMLDSMFDDANAREAFANADATTVRNLLLVILASIFFPFIFTTFFFIISFVFEIAYGILVNILHLGKSDHSLKNRLLGAGVGFVQAFLVAIIIFLPIGNVFNIVDQTVDTIRPTAEENEASEELVIMYDEVIDPIYCMPFKVTNAMGGKAIAKSLATIKIDGVKYDTRQCFVSFASIYTDLLKLEDIDTSSLTEQDKDNIRALANRITDDQFITSTIAGLLRETGNVLGQMFAEDTEGMEPDFQTVALTSLFDMLSSTTADTLRDDMDLCIDLLFLLEEEGVLEAMSNQDSKSLEEILIKRDGDGKTLIRRIIDMLNQNPSSRPIVDMLTKLSLSIMMEDVGDVEVIEEVYTEVKKGFDSINAIDSTLSDEEYTAEVSEVISSTLAENNIVIEDSMIEHMSEFVTENYKDVEITDEVINEIIFAYYDALVNDLSNAEN